MEISSGFDPVAPPVIPVMTDMYLCIFTMDFDAFPQTCECCEQELFGRLVSVSVATLALSYPCVLCTVNNVQQFILMHAHLSVLLVCEL